MTPFQEKGVSEYFRRLHMGTCLPFFLFTQNIWQLAHTLPLRNSQLHSLKQTLFPFGFF